MEIQHSIFVSATESVSDGVSNRSEFTSFTVDLESSESSGLVVLGQSTVVMDNTALLSGSGTVDAFEPTAHELVQVEIFRSCWKKSISDVISKGLELLRGENISQGGSVGDSSSDRSNETDDIDLSLSVSGDASREDGESGDSGKSSVSRGVRSSASDERRESVQDSLSRRLLTTDSGSRETSSSGFFGDGFTVLAASSMYARRGIRFSSSENRWDSLRKSIGNSG